MSGSSFVAANDSRQIFSVGSEAYTVRDLLDAASFRGELRPAWDKLLRLLACENRAANEDREPDEAAVDTAAQTFRYDHDLITAEETEQWLAQRGLTLSDFGDYFDRQYWGEALGDEVEPEAIPYFSASPDLRELLVADLMLSGELGRMANRLTWRLAVAREAANPPSVAAVAVQRAEFLQRLGLSDEGVAEWLDSLSRNETWLDEMLQLEAAYSGEREALLTPQARQRELGSLRLQLTVFDVEIIEFDSQDAASEALFCVREDGMAMEEVAAEGRYPFHREQLLLEDIGPDVQQVFLSVTPGEVLEPMELEGRYRLCRVTGKSEPNAEDPAVRRRIEQRLLDRHFAEAVSKHVRSEILWS